MNLSEIRDWVVQESGRYDLVEPSGADNGLNKYINAATRWLDKLIEKHSEVGVVYRTLSAGEYMITFTECRSIIRVGVSDASTFYGWLEKKTLDELKSESQYAEPFGSVTSGTPIYYTPAYLRAVNTETSNYTGFADWVNTLSNWKLYNGIILMPPADKDYLIEVRGKFHSEALSADDDENFWSVREPQLLVKATLRELEVFHRNTQGQKDWEMAIRAELFDIEKDFVEQNVTDINQLEG